VETLRAEKAVAPVYIVYMVSNPGHGIRVTRAIGLPPGAVPKESTAVGVSERLVLLAMTFTPGNKQHLHHLAVDRDALRNRLAL
jgi:hypothetical protein